MTPEKAKELLPVMEAYADGKVVQWRITIAEGYWERWQTDKWRDYDCTKSGHPYQPHWEDTQLVWRVKPAPLELWICPVCRMIFEFEPKYCCRGGVMGGTHEDTAPVKMREVLP